MQATGSSAQELESNTSMAPRGLKKIQSIYQFAADAPHPEDDTFHLNVLNVAQPTGSGLHPALERGEPNLAAPERIISMIAAMLC